MLHVGDTVWVGLSSLLLSLKVFHCFNFQGSWQSSSVVLVYVFKDIKLVVLNGVDGKTIQVTTEV